MANPVHAALSLFTVIPLPPVLDWNKNTTRGALALIPWVGGVIGAISAAVAALVIVTGAGPVLAAVIGMTCWIALTGGFHLDGVADTADGLASHKPAPEALAIMKQHDIGPMGVITLVLMLLINLACLVSPHFAGWAVLAVIGFAPVVGRMAALEGTCSWVSAARKDGMGSMYIGTTTGLTFLVNLVLVVIVSAGIGGLGLGWRGVLVFPVATIVSVGIAICWRRYLCGRLGGMTGDTLGSTLELSTTIFLLVAALAS